MLTSTSHTELVKSIYFYDLKMYLQNFQLAIFFISFLLYLFFFFPVLAACTCTDMAFVIYTVHIAELITSKENL